MSDLLDIELRKYGLLDKNPEPEDFITEIFGILTTDYKDWLLSQICKNEAFLDDIISKVQKEKPYVIKNFIPLPKLERQEMKKQIKEIIRLHNNIKSKNIKNKIKEQGYQIDSRIYYNVLSTLVRKKQINKQGKGKEATYSLPPTTKEKENE